VPETELHFTTGIYNTAALLQVLLNTFEIVSVWYEEYI